MKQSSFVKRVINALKGGDEAKLDRFANRVGKSISKQISMRKENIEAKNEKIVDIKESLDAYVVSIDLGKLTSADDMDRYAPHYIEHIGNQMTEIENLKEEVKALEAEIAQYEAIEKLVFSAE